MGPGRFGPVALVVKQYKNVEPIRQLNLNVILLLLSFKTEGLII